MWQVQQQLISDPGALLYRPDLSALVSGEVGDRPLDPHEVGLPFGAPEPHRSHRARTLCLLTPAPPPSHLRPRRGRTPRGAFSRLSRLIEAGLPRFGDGPRLHPVSSRPPRTPRRHSNPPFPQAQLAAAALRDTSLSPILSKTISRFVPAKLTETQFWESFFSHVDVIKVRIVTDYLTSQDLIAEARRRKCDKWLAAYEVKR